jgi:hypothetical protein
VATKSIPYSAFLRGPTAVLPALDEGDVVLERRDGDDVVLTGGARFEARREGMALATRVLRHLARTDPEQASDLVAEELPWLRWLPAKERGACVAELLGDLAAGAETGTLEPFGRTLAAWRSTAEVWADPELARRLLTPQAGDGPEILRPTRRT